MPSLKSDLVILAVLDGWGIASPGPGNAIAQANTPNMNKFWASFPHTELQASGDSVGLPRGEVGNTETGHLNLGAGRIVYQDLARINMSIADGSFFKNEVLLGAIAHAQKNNSNLHFMGLVGAGGVHSNLEHLFALVQMASRNNFNRLFLHLFTDGRDSPPTSTLTYINKIREVIKTEKVGQIASIMGRYWALDRDQRWERTQRAYQALTRGVGHLIKTPEEIISASYESGVTDEFIEPSLISSQDGKPIGVIKDNDAVIFFNFRIDRPRQLSRAFVFKDFEKDGSIKWDFDPYAIKYEKKHISELKEKPIPTGFDRGIALSNLYFATMTEYAKPLIEEGAKVAFPPQTVDMPLGRVISELGLRQLRASESEKERFVTFYFNGQSESAFVGEERLIVPSPKVALYDQKPEMSARELTNAVLNKIKGDSYKFILINYANADMVGHTGNIGACVRACEVVDECIGKLANFTLAYNGTLLITADHGNAEEMIDAQTGQIETEHSSNPVPFLAISNSFMGKSQTLQFGILADIAPTILNLLGLNVPGSMTGRNLFLGF
ncbi:MAG: 2,3-bisphosphoglycerate-independent phosphoglycerate mutase [Patescibacteria group bacterium]